MARHCFILFLDFLILCVCFPCTYACMCVICMPGAWGGYKKGIRSLEHSSRWFWATMWVLRTEPGPAVRVTSTLNYWASLRPKTLVCRIWTNKCNSWHSEFWIFSLPVIEILFLFLSCLIPTSLQPKQLLIHFLVFLIFNLSCKVETDEGLWLASFWYVFKVCLCWGRYQDLIPLYSLPFNIVCLFINWYIHIILPVGCYR